MLCDVEGVYIVQSVCTDHTVFVGHGKCHCIYRVLRHHACQNICEKLNLMDLGTFNFFFPLMTLCWHYSFTDKVSNIVRIYMLTWLLQVFNNGKCGHQQQLQQQRPWRHQQWNGVVSPALFASTSSIWHHHAPSPSLGGTLSCSLHIHIHNHTPSRSLSTSRKYIVLLSLHLGPQSDTITHSLHLQEVHLPALFTSRSTIWHHPAPSSPPVGTVPQKTVQVFWRFSLFYTYLKN